MNEFLLRLRERKLVQWSLAYIAAAFALIQVLDIVAQRFGWPEQAVRLIIVALSIGLFVTLVLAWYHGEHGAQRVTGTELVILALLLAIGGGLLWRFAGSARDDAAARSADAIPAKSVAVLPFENFSDDKANAYFAGGMRDEILTRLAGIRDLKVISRTSTEQYASHPPDLKTVGRQLGVATVLEGSVQRAGNTVHINLQLLDTQSDGHLWAESYDREMKDIFAVERDIAQTVAGVLKAKLLPEEIERVAEVATQNTEAHDLYLRGRAYFNRANDQFALTATETPQAIALFEQALAKDPGFALAEADLAYAHMNMYWFAPDRTPARLAAAKAAVDQALVHQPGLVEAHLPLALYYYWGFRDYAQALQHLEIARRAKPNDADVVQFIASIARRQAQWERAIEGYREAAALNPRASIAHFLTGEIYLQLRHYAESERAQLRAIDLAADPGAAHVRHAETLLYWKGDLAALRAALDALTPGSDAYSGNVSWFYRLAWWSRDYAGAIRIAESNAADTWTEAGNLVLPRKLCLAQAYAAAGDSTKAKGLFEVVRGQLQATLQSSPQSPDLHIALGFAAAGLGMKEEAIAEGKKAVALMPTSLDAFTGPVYFGKLAQIYVRVGANDEAIDILQQLFAMPAGHVVTPPLLKLDPVWDPLREDSRFKRLLTSEQPSVPLSSKP
ncbi:MAG TPA: tetratricopeptide repeat protein [Rudaea sp.]|nr:tetratricopeptide repeat protein [Rudaea sp.]